MVEIEIIENNLNYRGKTYGITKAVYDSIGALLYTNEGFFRFLFDETIVNGTLATSSIDFIIDASPLEKPKNWHGLEQSLRYSQEFAKAFQYGNPNGFSMFMTTLVNGKNGQATENALAFCFQVLGVSWTEQEKTNINSVLEANNFVYRLS